MANEIRISISLSFNKSGASLNRDVSFTADVTGDAVTGGIQEVGTSNEELVQGTDLGTPGWVFVKNLDSTNYVTLTETDAANYLIKLLPGEAAIFRCGKTAIYAKADTAACDVEYYIIEE